jgi:hypothetical protein
LLNRDWSQVVHAALTKETAGTVRSAEEMSDSRTGAKRPSPISYDY